LPPHRGLASLSASGKDARQHVTVIGLGAVGFISAIEAVRAGHRVTVIEALGFEPELWSDLRRRRASAFNLGERSEPEKAEAKPNPRANKFSPARMLFVGPNSAPNSGRIRP
jgi:2-polyprenyl-6-methoxyphenol hydroxylase-like FAD-dependent oxidoreductase